MGNTYVLEPADELGMITLLKLSSALDGVLIWVNSPCAFALLYKSVHILLHIRKVLYLFGSMRAYIRDCLSVLVPSLYPFVNISCLAKYLLL